MERIGYKVVLNFANLYGVEIEKREINGIMEDVMVVPLRLNGFYVSKKRGNKGVFYCQRLPFYCHFNATDYHFTTTKL